MNSDEAEPLSGSLTNEVVKTGSGTVLKKFAKNPAMAYVQMLGRIPSGKIEYQDQKDRIQNEKNFREFISDYDIKTPEILAESGRYVEFEFLNAVDLNDYVNKNPEEAREFGLEVGEFLNYIHEEDGAITDLRINNFMVSEAGEIAFLDAEYFLEDATGWEKKMDLITLVSSLRQVEPIAYRSFREGFETAYEDELGVLTDFISSLTSPIHALILERDLTRSKNAVKNIVGG